MTAEHGRIDWAEGLYLALWILVIVLLCSGR